MNLMSKNDDSEFKKIKIMLKKVEGSLLLYTVGVPIGLLIAEH